MLRPFLLNWEEVVRYFIRGVTADAAADGTPETAALLQRLLNYQGVKSALKSSEEPAESEPVLPLYFRKDEISLRLFTTIATLGTPRDITLQELRIECFFPIDQATTTILRDWAVGD